MFQRTPMIAGNWKMNLSLEGAVALAEAVGSGIGDISDVEVLVAPPFTHLAAVKGAIDESKIFLAGQNMHWEMTGAYTGEISGRMLQQSGCTHVILGHSERRMLFHETSEVINFKVRAASFLGLIPIVCVGETLEERESDRTFEVIKEQLDVSLDNCKADQMMPTTTHSGL